jgi:phosphoglycerol transferase MdoB-like AlkP superfamily enzyme
MVTTVANLIAFNNLTEMFIFETLRSFREIKAGQGTAKYDGTWHYLTLSLIVAWFVGLCIYIGIKFRKVKAGFSLRKLGAVGAAVMFVVAGLFTHLLAVDKTKNMSNLEKLTDPIFSLKYLTNRNRVLYSFGSPVYYFNNLLSLFGLKSMKAYPVSSGVLDGATYYDEYVDEDDNPLMLDADHNLIMLMMETTEFAGIHPVLTENLWKVRNMSTWVDGYHAIERTCFTEFTALTGGYASGAEMWRDYPNLKVPQSMPNIFRRSFEEANTRQGTTTPIKIGAYHPFSEEFYSRKWFFRDALGFDQIRDLEYYKTIDPSLPDIDPLFPNNDDALFMGAALNDIAPTDTRFFSYVLNISTHAPHFSSQRNHYGSTHTWINTATNQIETIPAYQDSLDFINNNYAELLVDFPKLESTNLDVKAACWTYLVGLHRYDKAVGLLLDHLYDTNLIENTALVFYSDHYDYMTYNNARNVEKGSVLTTNGTESPIGEKLSMMIYNPEDLAVINDNDCDAPGPLYNGRKVTGFASNNDVYKTVCHLFNVQTNSNFTLGNSVLARMDHGVAKDWRDFRDVSVAIGFYNGLFYGYDFDDPSLQFSTTDLKTFKTNTSATAPSPATLAAFEKRLGDYAGTLLALRRYYDTNGFKSTDATKYKMSFS